MKIKAKFTIIFVLGLVLLSLGAYQIAQAAFYKNINVNGTIFTLKYSNCSSDMPACLNEYYKKDETGNNWSELLTVVYAPDIADFHNFTWSLRSSQRNANLLEQTDEYDILTFYIPFRIDDKDYIEQNVAKITKSFDKKGAVSIQYATRHRFDPQNQEELREKMLEKTKLYSAALKLFPAPEMYLQPYQAWQN